MTLGRRGPPEKVDLGHRRILYFLNEDPTKPSLFLRNKGEILALVKPQFELSPAEAKKGVVRSETLQMKAVLKIDAEAKNLGLEVLGEVKSSLQGPKGNQEYFLYLRKKEKTE